MARLKKRGVKPGTKRGPYKRNKIIRTRIPNDEWAAMNSVGNNLPSLISELASTIDTLEAQLAAQIDRIKSILV